MLCHVHEVQITAWPRPWKYWSGPPGNSGTSKCVRVGGIASWSVMTLKPHSSSKPMNPRASGRTNVNGEVGWMIPCACLDIVCNELGAEYQWYSTTYK